MIQLILCWQIIKLCQAQPIKGEEELGHRFRHHDHDYNHDNNHEHDHDHDHD